MAKTELGRSKSAVLGVKNEQNSNPNNEKTQGGNLLTS